MNQFIETAVAVGRVYLLCCCPVGVILATGVLLYRSSQDASTYSVLKPMMDWLVSFCTLCVLFLVPGASIGSYIGDVLGAQHPFLSIFRWTGFFIGFLLALSVWQLLNRRFD